jgi:hypothetical protein
VVEAEEWVRQQSSRLVMNSLHGRRQPQQASFHHYS